jgi:hypothetical protein
MQTQGLGEDRAHGHAWVQARIRVLKDDLHFLTQHAQRALRQPRNVDAVEAHAARRGFDEP